MSSLDVQLRADKVIKILELRIEDRENSLLDAQCAENFEVEMIYRSQVKDLKRRLYYYHRMYMELFR